MSARRAAGDGPPRSAKDLPSRLSRLVGRDEALDELVRLVPASRLLTLTGAGGSGKTRLAAELAARVAAAGREVAWVDLSALAEPHLLAARVAGALGVREQPGRGAADALAEALAERNDLLVLDNCEHLVEAGAELIERLLAACPALGVLVTSREALRLAGERAWLVPPLALPPPDGDATPELIAAAGAVQLFAERAAEVSRAFALTPANAPAVARICRNLDGLPLAIELAAGRAGVLSVEQIADRLDDAFRLLTSGPRRAAARHRTLRATIGWSHSLLAGDERRLFRRLAVFVGGFSLEAAEAVGGDLGTSCDDREVLDVLASLVGKSLVVVEEHRRGPRYRLLETVRQYALEQLREAGGDEEEAARRRHAGHYAALVAAAEPHLMASEMAWIERLDADHDNVRAALAWSRAGGRDEEVGLPLAAAFHWYWYYRILWTEGRGWLEAVLAATDPAACTAARAAGLRGAGAFAWYCGDAAASRRHLEASIALWRRLGDPRQLSFALALLPQVLVAQGEDGAALAAAEEAVELARRSAWAYDLPYALTNGLAFVRASRGELAAADALYAEAEAVWRRLDHRLGLLFVVNARARAALEAGDHERAAGLARRALADAAEPPDPWFAARALRTLAYAELAAGRAARAASLLAGSEAQLRSIGARMMPYEVAQFEAETACLCRVLPPGELAAAEAEGRACGLAGAVRLAGEPAPALPAEACCADPPELCVVLEPPPRLVVRALGPLEVEAGGRRLTGAGWSAARAKELLFLLLCHPGGRGKEQIGVALWPDASPAQVHNSFHVTLHRLRRALGGGAWIVLDGDRYRLDPDLAVELDAHRFEAEVAAALADAAGGGDGCERLEAALALYRGPLFEGETVGDWHLPLRDRLEERLREGLAALAEAHAEAERWRPAADAWRRLAALDDLDEEAHRGLIAALAALGDAAGARRTYERLAARLREELDVEPEPETAALAARLDRRRATA